MKSISNMTKAERMYEAHSYALLLVEGVQWLEACPFPDGSPFYETAGRQQDEIAEEIVMLVLDVADPATIETIRGWVEQGEWAELRENEDPDPEDVWDAIATLINEDTRRQGL